MRKASGEMDLKIHKNNIPLIVKVPKNDKSQQVLSKAKHLLSECVQFEDQTI